MGKKVRFKMCFSDCINEISVIWGERFGWGLVFLGLFVLDGNVVCVRGMFESRVGVLEEGENWLYFVFILYIFLVENGGRWIVILVLIICNSIIFCKWK